MPLIGKGKPQSLVDILQAKDARAAMQARLLTQYQKPLLSFKLNIPGAVKYNELIKRIFEAGIAALRYEFNNKAIVPLFEAAANKQSGPEFLAVVDVAPAALKQLTWQIEEAHPLGRLFDYDVFAENGEQYGREAVRQPARSCYLCGRQAFACARSREHSVTAMLTAIQVMYDAYFV